MPNLVVRITDTEKADLEARAQDAGQKVSEYVRETLALRTDKRLVAGLVAAVNSLGDVAEIHERRLTRLEQFANLD